VDDRDAGSNAPEPTKIGKGVVQPHIIYAPDPSYTEKAKRENFQGVSVLSLIIGKDGRAHHIKPVRIIGDGLDQKAIDAVSQWKFQPATKDGQPVSVFVTVEVAFHLY
jgi:TonB family protein